MFDSCQGVEKKILGKCINFFTFYPKIISPWAGGSWNLECLVSLSYRWYIPNLVKIIPKSGMAIEQCSNKHDCGLEF